MICLNFRPSAVRPSVRYLCVMLEAVVAVKRVVERVLVCVCVCACLCIRLRLFVLSGNDKRSR